MESVWILRQSKRLLKCLSEIMVVRNDGVGMKNTLELLSCIEGCCWSDIPKALKQIDKIGEASAKTLFNAGIKSIRNLLQEDGRRIETLRNRVAPFGNELKKSILNSTPIAKVTLEDSPDSRISGRVEIQNCESGTFLNTTIHVLIVGYNEKVSAIIKHMRFGTDALKEETRNFTLDIQKNYSEIIISLINESYSGLNQHIILDLKSNRKEVDQRIPSTPHEDIVTPIFALESFSSIHSEDLVQESKSDIEITPRINHEIMSVDQALLEEIAGEQFHDRAPSAIPSKRPNHANSFPSTASGCKHACRNKTTYPIEHYNWD